MGALLLNRALYSRSGVAVSHSGARRRAASNTKWRGNCFFGSFPELINGVLCWLTINFHYIILLAMVTTRGVTTLKKVVRNACQGRFAGGGAALFKEAPMPKCTIFKMQHSTGAT